MADPIETFTAALRERYTIHREVGRGGMATVYLAEDLRHRRQVAIKIVRPELATLLSAQRFLREIQIASRLQHPHILPLYDSGEAGECLFYVMPYVEGESLRHRLLREKQLPIDDAVQIAREVADALHHAHGHGVMHRDIKPENILLESGHAVVADFGIARAVTAAETDRLTSTGVVLGTVVYMSPEQAAGEREVDGRTDVYSLGCVLYEMLAGQPPFTGPTAESVVKQHLIAEPPLVTAIRPAVPGWLAATVRETLAKTAADRPSPAAFLAATRGRTTHGAADEQQRRTARGVTRLRWLPWALPIALGAVIAVMLMQRLPERGPGAISSMIPAPPGHRFLGSDRGLALSPDASMLAFIALAGESSVAGESSGGHLWVRRLDRGGEARLAGTDGARLPFWAPDGRSLGFFAGGQLKTISVTGSDLRNLCPVIGGDGGAWSDDGVIVYGPTGQGLHRTTAEGGPCVPALRRLPSQTAHRRPSFLPDGRHVVFHDYASGLWVGNLHSGDQKPLRATGVSPAFEPPSRLLFVHRDQLLAQEMDLRGLRLIGEAALVYEPLPPSSGGMAPYAISDNGMLVVGRHRTVGSFGRARLVWLDRGGRSVDSLNIPRNTWTAALSPSETKLAFGGLELWTVDLSSRGTRKIGGSENPPAPLVSPVWSPNDSLLIVQQSYATVGTPGFRVHDLRKGTSEPLPGLDSASGAPTDWSRDGRFLLFARNPANGDAPRGEIWLYSFAERRAERLFSAPYDVSEAKFSPDGRAVAYRSTETGRVELYIRAFPITGESDQVTKSGVVTAAWARDDELLFLTPGGRIMSATIVRGATPRLSSLSELIAPSFYGEHRLLLPARDGKRIGVLILGEFDLQFLTLISSWPTLIERPVPRR